jgi:hypothetical protein
METNVLYNWAKYTSKVSHTLLQDKVIFLKVTRETSLKELKPVTEMNIWNI